jgi:hypothetical protein
LKKQRGEFNRGQEPKSTNALMETRKLRKECAPEHAVVSRCTGVNIYMTEQNDVSAVAIT